MKLRSVGLNGLEEYGGKGVEREMCVVLCVVSFSHTFSCDLVFLSLLCVALSLVLSSPQKLHPPSLCSTLFSLFVQDFLFHFTHSHRFWV